MNERHVPVLSLARTRILRACVCVCVCKRERVSERMKEILELHTQTPTLPKPVPNRLSSMFPLAGTYLKRKPQSCLPNATKE